MPNKRTTKGPSRDEFLKEYEFCQKTAQSMETTIWQTGAAMSLGLVGSFLLVAVRGPESQPRWYLALLIGFFTSSVALIWWFVARRWWSVQHAMFMRMRHIEARLGLHSLTYVQYLDDPTSIPPSALSEAEANDLVQRADHHTFIGLKDHQRAGVQAFLWLLPLAMLFAWCLYAFFLLVEEIIRAG